MNMKGRLLAASAVFLLTACGNAEQSATSQSSNIPAAPEKVAQKPEPKPPATLREAIAIARPLMTDINGAELDTGTAALAIWSAEYMKWAELQELPTGKYAMVMKDSESQRGSKLCLAGTVIEIAVDGSIPGKKIYLGGMFDDGGRITRFIAVRSTGEIVERSRARFCGVITGQQHYQNSAGGTAHAVHLVGMFDLPENR